MPGGRIVTFIEAYFVTFIEACVVTRQNFQYNKPKWNLLEPGPLYHSRWLTLACRILRYYVSVENTSAALKLLSEYCVTVYFPTWFHIKANKYLTDGPKNLHFLVQRIMKLSNAKIRNIALHYVQINAFFTHPENILLSMLSDEDPTLGFNFTKTAPK